ncbi:MAG: phosphopyruvate hydratase [Candidatus Diapherotrites archaeon]|nr:phosphopyruvate hydratase [Candidatus Diapherotrites archaeon]
MCLIAKIHSRQVLDSRGTPTIETTIFTDYGSFSAMVPSGASTGSFEAVELRDNGKSFHGKSVQKAIQNVNQIIAPKLKNFPVCNQKELDQLLIKLDGTENKRKLGANAILSVSLAAARASAFACDLPLYSYLSELAGTKTVSLPVPQMNVINGGKHAGFEHDVQEHMFFPSKFKTFSQALQASTDCYHELKNLLKKKFGPTAIAVGDEGGFVPPLNSVEKRLDFMTQAIDEQGYSGKISLALDCAASEFYNKETHTYKLGNKIFSSSELIDFYSELISKYPIVSIEDGFAEEDWQAWQMFTKKMSKKIQIVGDDLLVTNSKRIQKAIKQKSCNSLLLKVNQIGTLTESIQAFQLARKHNWNVVVSHRSGETEDSFIADLVVGLNAGQSKFGAPARSERTAKYNRLLAIEEEPGKKAVFAGKLF